MTIKKFTVSKSELLFYLEEVIEMNNATELEQEVYYTYRHTGKLKNSETVQQILRKMKKLHNEKY